MTRFPRWRGKGRFIASNSPCEFALEFAWETLKDYLEHEGAVIQPVTPRSVIKEAFSAQILRDGRIWIDMLDHRNLLSHTYDSDTFEKAVRAIQDRYHVAIEEFHAWLMERGLT